MTTSLIITAYHKTPQMVDMTRNCVESAIKYAPNLSEILVVDDASPIEAHFKDCVVIKRGENGGFPRCANTGFANAKGDILILSNNDITFAPNWLEAILKPLHEEWDISSIRVSDADGFETEDKITDGDRFGSLWAMKRKVYETIGGFDEDFGKGCWEDTDYYFRAKAAGFKIGKNHAVVVEHIGRATMDVLYPNKEDFIESRKKFIDKWGFEA